MGSLVDESSGKRAGTPVAALGGPAAARIVAEAAEMLGVVARASTEWDEAAGAVAQAESIRGRAAELAEADTEAHAVAMRVLEHRAELRPEARDYEIGTALADAAAVPLAIAELAVSAAELAAEAARRGAPEVQPDAVVACLLAEAAGRAGVHLTEVNLGVQVDDERLGTGQRLIGALSEARRRALED